MSDGLRGGIPRRWKFLGVALERGAAGECDSAVTGDPCIVWDPARNAYRMLYFAQRHAPGGERNSVAHAVSASPDAVGAGAWRKLGPIRFVNPELLPNGQTHKPWVLMDPYHPNRAVTIEGEYLLFSVSFDHGHKIIQLARSPSLDGPWTLQTGAVLRPGAASEHDGLHVDTVTAYWFADRKRILLFYKAYPASPQPDQPLSPWGSSLCAAEMEPGDAEARKLGRLIAPVQEAGHWMSGWASGLQLMPSAGSGWFGLMTGSPTPPASVSEEPRMREPAPSLGGWAHTSEPRPVGGWTVDTQPIRWIDDLPDEARRLGMGTNLWRHHLLVLPESGGGAGDHVGGDEGHAGRMYLYHNSGAYGEERMFVWSSGGSR
jgi:hypothetical protein